MQNKKLHPYPPFFHRYICLAENDNLLDAFNKQQRIVKTYFSSLIEKANYAYADNKWTLTEMLQHIIDTERIFSYRALCIARGDKTPLPGFDENSYASNSNAQQRNWLDICDELKAVRNSTEILFNSFTEEMLLRTGTADGNEISVISIGYIVIGHVYHHKKIIEERYL